LGRSTSVEPETVAKKLQAVAAKEDDAAIVREAGSLIFAGEFSRSAAKISRGPTPPEAVTAWSDTKRVEAFMRSAHRDEAPPTIPQKFLNQDFGLSRRPEQRLKTSSRKFVTEADALKALQRCQKKSSPGPSGWSRELLLPVFLKSCIVRDAITWIVEQILNNSLPPESRAIITECNLIPLIKDEKSLRPIAIGDLLLKMASLHAFTLVPQAVVFQSLQPEQYGVGVVGGAEHIIHLLRGTRGTHHVLSVDCRNAFNSVKKQTILDALLESPTFHPLVDIFLFEYGSHSPLFCADAMIPSRTGVRQGSVLGPLFFSPPPKAKLILLFG
jgi:hypothetical protein